MAGEAYPTRLENLAREAAFKLKRADEYRTSASILLAECRQRVEAGDPEAHGVAWSEYCRVHFSPYPPSYLGRLIRADAQPEGLDDQVDIPAREDPFDRAWAAFVTLELERQKEFLRCGAAYAIHPEEAAPHPDPEGHAEPSNALSWLA
jgi:hypothetical protein